ncbi:MAG: hypothetical protein NW223_21490 [Hyphomicrobiaceae bacterium]|nr:hypothetical protein [Hyphomicrobiaceae bacterium]
MRFANLICATIIVSALFGAAIAQGGDRRPAIERSSVTPAVTWLWQPAMRRAAH